MNKQIGKSGGIPFGEIAFKETPTNLVAKAVAEFHASQPKFRTESESVGDSFKAECRLANQVVGAENP